MADATAASLHAAFPKWRINTSFKADLNSGGVVVEMPFAAVDGLYFAEAPCLVPAGTPLVDAVAWLRAKREELGRLGADAERVLLACRPYTMEAAHG